MVIQIYVHFLSFTTVIDGSVKVLSSFAALSLLKFCPVSPDVDKPNSNPTGYR